MFSPKEGVFDRIEQTFFVMKSNIFTLILPIFVFHIFYFALIWKAYFYYMIQNFSFIFSQEEVHFFEILYSPKGIYFIAIALALIFIYLFLYIPFLLATIRGVDQSVNGKKVTIIDNIIWGGKNLFQSFYTYRYIFAYIYLFPAIIFICGGILFNVNALFLDEWIYSEVVNKLSIAALMFGFFVAIVSAIYKGFRTTFSLYNAVRDESFTKENFVQSVKITKNNWWRIVGNFILVGFIFSFAKNIISTIINLFVPSSIDFDLSSLNLDSSVQHSLLSAGYGNIEGMPTGNQFNQGDLISMFQNTIESYSYVNAVIGTIVGEFIDTIFLLAGFIFTYIFMTRLISEHKKSMNLKVVNQSAIDEKYIDNIDNTKKDIEL